MNDLHVAAPLGPDNYRLGWFVPKPVEIHTPRAVIMAQVEEIALRHGVATAAIMGPNQTHKVARARFEVFAYIRKAFGWSTPRIGRFVGDRDHSTVLHGLKRHNEIIAQAAA